MKQKTGLASPTTSTNRQKAKQGLLASRTAHRKNAGIDRKIAGTYLVTIGQHSPQP